MAVRKDQPTRRPGMPEESMLDVFLCQRSREERVGFQKNLGGGKVVRGPLVGEEGINVDVLPGRGGSVRSRRKDVGEGLTDSWALISSSRFTASCVTISAGNADGFGGVTASYLPPAEAARPVVDSGMVVDYGREGDDAEPVEHKKRFTMENTFIRRNWLSRMTSPPRGRVFPQPRPPGSTPTLDKTGKGMDPIAPRRSCTLFTLCL